ncbi:hypothetical protein [Galbitalea soli]|uniref:DNA polymerase III subunit gamma/tau n=1 Tax=Galbitalea soli TaxID=1268042 RepID=A0A7C9PNH9_9MICO|nr:hypothetical protein [Galbitalea soli]NEM91451.1 hypothetical protein [Galbitalea soli]NYJ30144.1 hypothetical protein [Galbitalea soli]
MARDDDEDEALRWDEGDDHTHALARPARTPAQPRTPPPPRADADAGAGGDAGGDAGAGAGERADADADAEAEVDFAPVASSILLVTLGILGGVYLLYTIGWIVSLQRLVYASGSPLDDAAFAVEQYLAVVAPALWFGLALALTRGRAAYQRLLWLVGGALLLIPWSFVVGS